VQIAMHAIRAMGRRERAEGGGEEFLNPINFCSIKRDPLEMAV